MLPTGTYLANGRVWRLGSLKYLINNNTCKSYLRYTILNLLKKRKENWTQTKKQKSIVQINFHNHLKQWQTLENNILIHEMATK